LSDWRLLCVRIGGLFVLGFLVVVGHHWSKLVCLLMGSLLLRLFFRLGFLLGGLLCRLFLLLRGSLGWLSRRFVLGKMLRCSV